jgi:hypothetical protein
VVGREEAVRCSVSRLLRVPTRVSGGSRQGASVRDLGTLQPAWQAFLRREWGAKQVVHLIGRYARDCVDSRWVMVDVVHQLKRTART